MAEYTISQAMPGVQIEEQLAPVTFHGDTIFCIDYEGQPYTPMKPIVENMALDWRTQQRKLSDNAARWGMVIMTIPSASGEQEMVCLPVRKLPAFLASINPKKVRPELRPKIELYQNESDDALWNYWMNGRAERVDATPSADAPLTPDQQCTLQAIVRAKVEALPLDQQNKGTYPKVWSRFNNHFRIARYSQLPQSRMSEAVAYLTRMEILPPAPEQLCLPAAPAVLDEQAQKVQSLVNEVKQRGNEFMSSIFTLQSTLRFRPVKMDHAVPDLSKALERNLPQFATAIDMNVSALSDLLDVYCSTLTGTSENTSSPASVQPSLPTTGDLYEDANARLEEIRRKYHTLRDEAGKLLVEVMMDDERKMPPQLLVKMPTPITDMTENFFRNSIDLHQSWSSNPVLLIRELHNALGLKREAPLAAK